MALLVEYFAFRSCLQQQWRMFMTPGFLGGFTTFSAFSLDAALLYERGRLDLAVFYTIASVVLSVGALFGALALVRAIMRV